MKATNTILDKIVAAKKAYLQQQKITKPRIELERQLASMPPIQVQGFYEALKVSRPRLKIIGEVKKASPSAGVLRDPFVLSDINQAYQADDNIVAISVITEKDFFGSSEDNLAFFASNNTNHKPLLRKDFIIEPYQISESKLLGAQAYLLIAALFTLRELQKMVDYGLRIGIEPLVEVHTNEELAMTRQTAARCIGVNSRALSDFSVDVKAHELLKELPDNYARVAESGIDSPERLEAISGFADAALIGSHFMRSSDIKLAIEQIVLPGSNK